MNAVAASFIPAGTRVIAVLLLLWAVMSPESVKAIPAMSAMPGNGSYSYDASGLDSPYLRSTNYYGYDKIGQDDDDLWTGLIDGVELPFLTNFGLSLFYDDSVLLNNLNKQGSFGTRFSPSLTVPMGNQKLSAVFQYNLNASLYDSLSYANTLSHYMTGSTTLEFDHRNRLTLTARGAFAQDPIGTLFTQGAAANTVTAPSHWSGYGFDGHYQYGAPGAQGNLGLLFSTNNREYSNNQNYTYQRDMNAYDVGGYFLWRVMPKTQLLFEVNDTLLDYPNQLNTGGSLNGSTYRAYTGVTWQATAKTRAVAKVGYQWRTYEDAQFQARSSPAFQGMLYWQPGSYDTVWLEVANAINEGLIAGSSSTETQNVNVNWRRAWLERLYTSVGVYYLSQQYTNAANVTNNTLNGRISAYYTFHPGVWADLQYTYTDRTSSQNQYDVTRNLILLNLRMMF